MGQKGRNWDIKYKSIEVLGEKCWTKVVWKILKEMGILDHLYGLVSWETYMHVRKQQLELDMEKQTGSK